MQLQPLPWDSQFLGYPVARIVGAAELPAATVLRRRLSAQGIRLAYWSGSALQPGLQDCFVVSQLELRANLAEQTPGRTSPAADLPLKFYDVYGRATAELQQLAQLAGWGSRFRLDHGFAAEICDRLYTVWLDRSCSKEIADRVLVAQLGNDLAGFVTLRLTAPQARIGLLAVAASLQGCGIGRGLLLQALQVARAAGCHELSVVTQQQNQAAVRLYEAVGFQQAELLHWYHIRTQEQSA
ncbi:MAG: GNAT family N-acetyltransferase [Planctomycetaceae bacterium]